MVGTILPHVSLQRFYTLTGNTFTKDDLLRFVPLFNALYSKCHNAECVINEAIDTLLSEGKIVLVSPGCYTPK